MRVAGDSIPGNDTSCSATLCQENEYVAGNRCLPCPANATNAMGDAMRFGTYEEIQLLRPFIAMDKAQIAARGAELGVDFAQTWSCYKGGEEHCGCCGTCVERREAFDLASVDDPTVYASGAPSLSSLKSNNWRI